MKQSDGGGDIDTARQSSSLVGVEADKATSGGVIAALREVPGPFHHMPQIEGEAVSAFIRRLERTFLAAYGADKLSPGTKGAFCMDSYRKGYVHAVQMCPEHSPRPSQAAKNEKKRLEATINPSKAQSLGVLPAKKSTC